MPELCKEVTLRSYEFLSALQKQCLKDKVREGIEMCDLTVQEAGGKTQKL